MICINKGISVLNVATDIILPEHNKNDVPLKLKDYFIVKIVRTKIMFLISKC